MNANLPLDPDLPLWAAGLCLSRELALHYDLPEAVIYDFLGHIPATALDALECPDGWAALGDHIASEYRLPVNPYRPTIH